MGPVKEGKRGWFRVIKTSGGCVLLVLFGYGMGRMERAADQRGLGSEPGTVGEERNDRHGASAGASTSPMGKGLEGRDAGETVVYTFSRTKESVAKVRGMAPKDCTTGILLMMCEDCDLEDFDAAWKTIEESGLSASDKWLVLGRLCGSICGKGGFGLVLDRILKLDESGADKNRLIITAFGVGETDLPTLWDSVGKLGFADERKAAVEGIAGQVRREDRFPETALFPKFEDKEVQDTIGSAFGERLLNVEREARQGEVDRTWSALKRMISEGKSDDAILASFLRGASGTAPKEAWQMWKKTGYGKDAGDPAVFRQVPRQLALGLVDHGGDYAMSQLAVSELESRPEDAKLSGLAYYKWLGKDMNGATKWLSMPPAGFGGLQADYVYQAAVQYNLEHGQVDAAKEWADRIGDAKLREDTLNRVRAR